MAELLYNVQIVLMYLNIGSICPVIRCLAVFLVLNYPVQDSAVMLKVASEQAQFISRHLE